MTEIYKSTFYDIVKSITQETGDKTNKKWEKDAMTILHEESEKYLVEQFKKAREVMATRNASTLKKEDLHCVETLKMMDVLYSVDGKKTT